MISTCTQPTVDTGGSVDVGTPILIIRETFPNVTSAYYFLLYFPYYVGSLLSFDLSKSFLFFSLFFSYLNGLD